MSHFPGHADCTLARYYAPGYHAHLFVAMLQSPPAPLGPHVDAARDPHGEHQPRPAFAIDETLDRRNTHVNALFALCDRSIPSCKKRASASTRPLRRSSTGTHRPRAGPRLEPTTRDTRPVADQHQRRLFLCSQHVALPGYGLCHAFKCSRI